MDRKGLELSIELTDRKHIFSPEELTRVINNSPLLFLNTFMKNF